MEQQQQEKEHARRLANQVIAGLDAHSITAITFKLIDTSMVTFTTKLLE